METRRWRRFGLDRLYVSMGENDLGWADLASGELHPITAEARDQLAGVVTAWFAENGGAGEVDSAALPTTAAEDTAPQAGPHGQASADDDLAARRAGQMARARAQALRQAAPVRTFVARLVGAHTDERAWRLGADGEERVAARLEKLARRDPRWQFLHAVPVGDRGSDIDHVAIGYAGVYTINAKHHPHARIWVSGDTFLVNGVHQPYIRNARHEARRAARLLGEACGFPVPVMGVVAPVGADEITIRVEPEGVAVVNRWRIGRWLGSQPETLADEKIEQIFAVARRAATWRPHSDRR